MICLLKISLLSMINDETIHYIVDFIINAKDSTFGEFVSYQHYSDNLKSKVLIQPSSFFDEDVYGTKKSLPQLPLQKIEDTPILFGEPVIEQKNGIVILHADIIASTYFLITRYEEMVRKDVRDKFGRFPGKESLPYRAGFISTPIVEEYGKLLRKCLRLAGIHVEEPTPHFSHIYLTHDVDTPWTHYSLTGAIKRICGELYHHQRFILHPLLNYLGYPDNDPGYTFKYLIEADHQIADAECIYFIKSGGHIKPMDSEPYILEKGFSRLRELLGNAKTTLGYHVSYEAGKDTGKIQKELDILRKTIGSNITYSRNHYLASCEPSDFQVLIENGITDDFTMGYADVAGFRLGTCRSVRWIDPTSGCLTKLTLHPLTIMDVSLTSPQYMGLNEISSQKYGDMLIEKTFLLGGELTLLWHNNISSGDIHSIDWNNYLHFLHIIEKKNV